MKVKKLVLVNFRNYEKRELELSEGATALVGPNAVGKTNILEALRMISLGESIRAGRIEEMVRFQEELGKTEALIEDEGEEEKLTVIVTRGEVQGKRVAKRRFLVDDAGKKKADFVGRMASVVFRPQDIELIDGSPSTRRRWMDGVLSQASYEYSRSLGAYEKALRRRNRILEAIRDEAASRYQLTFWDGLVVKHGLILTAMREEMVNYMNEIFRRSDLFKQLRLEYDKSVVNERRLKQYEKEEVMAGHTLVGPHKDDLMVKEVNGNERDLAVYGSRGEQRMAVLGMKMGELLFLEEKTGKKPILLLDDVFSELDEEHAFEVRRVMQGRQAVVTTTEMKDVEGLEDLKVIELDYEAREV